MPPRMARFTASLMARAAARLAALGLLSVLAAANLAPPAPAHAAERAQRAAEAEPPGERAPRRGPVTNLPLPRFVSLKTNEANARRGPSLTHRIDWVFTRENMPLEITAEYGHWRRVRDRDGMGGWVHYALLSGARTVLVETDLAELRARADAAAPVIARAELGVVARLRACAGDWCRIDAGGYRGWAPRSDLWGVRPGETID